MVCAASLPESDVREQITIRLRGNTEIEGGALEETLGLGYVTRRRHNAMAVCGPRPVRDFSHRNCIPKDRYDALLQQVQGERESAADSRRRFVLTTPATADARPQRTSVFDADAATRSTPHRDRRTEYNARQVERYRAQADAASSEIASLKAQLSSSREKVWELRGERDSALRRERTASENAASTERELSRVRTRLGTALEDACLRKRLREEADIAKCERDAANELLKATRDRASELHAERDSALRRERAALENAASTERELSRVRTRLVNALEDACPRKRLREEAHDANSKLENVSAQLKQTRQKLWEMRLERNAAWKGTRESSISVREIARLRAQLEDSQDRERSLRMQLREERRQRDAENLAAVEVLQRELFELERIIHGGRGWGEGLVHKVEKASILRSELGLAVQKLPEGDVSETHVYFRALKFLASTLQRWPPSMIAAALKRNDQLADLFQTAPVQPHIKASVRGALDELQSFWSARHALMLQIEVHCSRSEYDALRHLISFAYNHQRDVYERLVVWKNPCNPNDALQAPALAARPSYEKERAMLYNLTDSAQSDDGLFCGVQNMEKALVSLVEHYWDALEPAVVQGEKPLLLVFTGDATGGWRGDALTHAEITIGSWAKGRGASKLAALPLFMMEGDDSAENLRNRASAVAKQYNDLKRAGRLVVTIDKKAVELRITLLCAADFQFFKAMLNMSKYTSAVWCMCNVDNLFKRPAQPARTYAEVESFYNSIQCELKDLPTICELNHFSYEVMMGNKFKPFTCRCGYKSGSEHEWRAAVQAHAQLEEEDRKHSDLAHSSMPEHVRHKPYNPPLLHQGTIDNSADVLHLVFINIFATFFELTMLVHVNELEPRERQPFETYLRSLGVQLKIVKAKNVTEMRQSLNGRDAKTILAKASTVIPSLLEFAHASKEEIVHAMAESGAAPEARSGEGNRRSAQAANEEAFDWESESDQDDGADDVGQHDEDALTRLERDAQSWDALMQLVYALRPFDHDDSQAYREARAVETFNAAADVMKEYKRLHPNAQSACPHVALCVLPRQQVSSHASLTYVAASARNQLTSHSFTCCQVVHGDHHRRGSDHSESFGASMKDTIHRRTLRRKIGSTHTVHVKRGKDGSIEKVHQQRALQVSRVMQAFRSAAVTERIAREEDSQKYLGRKHFRVAATGFSTAAQGAASFHSAKVEPTDENSIYTHLSKRAMEATELA